MASSSTTLAQRIGIWVIAIVLAVGFVGGFIAYIFANQNTNRDQASQSKAIADYQAAVARQTDDLSKRYYPVLSAYADQVGAFDAAAVTERTSEDLKAGDGAAIGDTSSYSAYYIGFNPSGKVFDQSIDGDKLKAPLPVEGNTGLIEGWTKGVVGMKLGGVRELTIPAAQAYGSQSPSADIPANTPLKFIILAIPTPKAVPVPSILTQQQ